jgi:hypothetical protein
MYKFYYHICTISNGNKYCVRKYIYDNDFNYVSHDEYSFTYKNVNTLINKLDKFQFKKFDTSSLERIEMPTKDDIIKSVVDIAMGDSGNGQVTFERFLNGNFSYP